MTDFEKTLECLRNENNKEPFSLKYAQLKSIYLRWANLEDVNLNSAILRGAIEYSDIGPVLMGTGGVAVIGGQGLIRAVADELMKRGGRLVRGGGKALYQVSKRPPKINPDWGIRERADPKYTNQREGYNKKTGQSLREEFVDETIEWYNSPRFNKMMEKEYPDVDIDNYKRETLKNLEREPFIGCDKISGMDGYNPQWNKPAIYGLHYPDYNYDRAIEYAADQAKSNATIEAKRLYPGIFSKYKKSEYVKKAIEDAIKNKVEFLVHSSLGDRLRDYIGKPKRDRMFGRTAIDESLNAFTHEMDHQRTGGCFLTPRLGGSKTFKVLSFYSSPFSNESVIIGSAESSGANRYNKYTWENDWQVKANSVRKDLQKAGIVDYHKDKVKPKHIREYFYGDNLSESEIVRIKNIEDEYDVLRARVEMLQYGDGVKYYKSIQDKIESKPLLSTDAEDMRRGFDANTISNILKKLP